MRMKATGTLFPVKGIEATTDANSALLGVHALGAADLRPPATGVAALDLGGMETTLV